jgi:CheY-like chemotaxis protein
MPLRVLVIDPNAAAASLVHHTLGREGYEVATAATLDAGLSQFNALPADLVLLSSGAEPERLPEWWHEAASDALKHTPILVLGAGAEGVVSAAGTVPTPIDADDLVAKVRSHLGAPEPTGNLAWLPDSLREASEEIADMERLLGWPGAGREAASLAEGQDPVSLGIFTEAEVHGMPAPAQGEGHGTSGPGATGAEAAGTPAEAAAEVSTESVAVSGGDAPAEPSRRGEAAGPKGPASKVRPQPAAPFAGVPPERLEQIVTEIAREAVERVVWETVPAMVARYISQSRAEQDRLFTQIVERVVWETVPEIAESQVKAEIERISEGDEA